MIEFKPRPEYSAEGRRQKIEGEVVLEVLFKASGTAEAIRTVRGLGFGLEEAAWKAVPAIRFRPATLDGHSVDQLATVHFIFKLAY